MEVWVDDHVCTDFRASLRDALSIAEAGGLPAEVQMTLLISELGGLIAKSAGSEFEKLLTSALAAVEHASRAARGDLDYKAAVERFVDRWLN